LIVFLTEMAILFIQHVKNEGPGIFKLVLDELAISSHTIETFSDEHISLPSNCKGVVILGGPMNVDEELNYPFLKEEKEFIKDMLKKEIPLLGICLGAQLITQVAGGSVFKAEKKEIGWYPVTLSDGGTHDFLFQGVPRSFEVFQWHEDTFEIPPRGERLVTSYGCVNQGFKIGKYGYGVQFHLEADATMIHDWLDSDTENQISSEVESMKRETAEKIQPCLEWGKKLLLNFLQIAGCNNLSNNSIDSPLKKC